MKLIICMAAFLAVAFAADGDKSKPKDLTVDDMENYSRDVIQLHAAYVNLQAARAEVDKATWEKINAAQKVFDQMSKVAADKVTALQEKYNGKGCTLEMVSKAWACPTKEAAK